MLGDHPYHIAGKKYADAVRLAGCLPLVIPNADEIELQALLAIADGVFLTGSPSNVHPSHFDEDVLDLSLPLDPARDAWTLPLIRHALAVGLPLFTVCRGTQETNVALGGSLHQAVHDVAGKSDHRADHGKPVDVQYGPAHEVFVEPGGVLERVVGLRNSTSIPCTARPSTGSATACAWRRARPTASSRRSRPSTPEGSTSACSGIPNGKLPATMSRCACSPPSGRPVDSGRKDCAARTRDDDGSSPVAPDFRDVARQLHECSGPSN